jgi:hypothetical protein
LASIFRPTNSNGTSLIGDLQHFIVKNAGIHLGDVQHGVTTLAKLVHNLSVYALISQNIHAEQLGEITN